MAEQWKRRPGYGETEPSIPGAHPIVATMRLLEERIEIALRTAREEARRGEADDRALIAKLADALRILADAVGARLQDPNWLPLQHAHRILAATEKVREPRRETP